MIRRACYVACDQCNGNPAQVSTDDAKDARLIARQEGYVRTPMGEDLCPQCAGKVWDGVRWRWPVTGGSTRSADREPADPAQVQSS